MMNKIKYLFLLVVCAGLIGNTGNVAAQSGGQANINGLINYYEWLFETQFTSGQRSQYNEIKEEDLRLDYANEKKGIDSLTANFAKIKSKNEDEQTRVRSTILGDFVKQLQEAGSDNKEAVFLLSVYNAAQAKAEREAAANGTGDIGAYAGKWVWAYTGTGVTVGGVWAGGNGTRITYQFGANGTVEYTGIMNSMMGGCSQQVFLSQKGRASISGNKMTIKWSPGTSTRDYSCDKAGNYTKTAPAMNETFPVFFKTNSTGQKLFCMKSGGKETCYSPSK